MKTYFKYWWNCNQLLDQSVKNYFRESFFILHLLIVSASGPVCFNFTFVRKLRFTLIGYDTSKFIMAMRFFELRFWESSRVIELSVTKRNYLAARHLWSAAACHRAHPRSIYFHRALFLNFKRSCHSTAVFRTL